MTIIIITYDYHISNHIMFHEGSSTKSISSTLRTSAIVFNNLGLGILLFFSYCKILTPAVLGVNTYALIVIVSPIINLRHNRLPFCHKKAAPAKSATITQNLILLLIISYFLRIFLLFLTLVRHTVILKIQKGATDRRLAPIID